MHIATSSVVIAGPSGFGVACTPAGCFQVALLLRTVVLALSCAVGLLATFSSLSDARAVAREERRRVRAEAEAFDAFSDRVSSLDPVVPSMPGGPTPATATEGALASPSKPIPAALIGSESTGLAALEEAYRETVMAVDHFEEDYDESLVDHVRAELGPEVAGAFARGDEFSPGFRTAVVDAAGSARAEREAFLRKLAAEVDALGDVSAHLRSIEDALDGIRAEPRIAGFDVLSDRWHRLGRLEDGCTDAVADRRASLADRGAFDLAAYLYTPLGTPYPVLAAAAGLVGEIREERRRAIDVLARVV